MMVQALNPIKPIKIPSPFLRLQGTMCGRGPDLPGTECTGTSTAPLSMHHPKKLAQTLPSLVPVRK